MEERPVRATISFLTCIPLLLLSACGGEIVTSLRQERLQGLDAASKRRLDFEFRLPDRGSITARDSTTIDRLNAYYYRFEGEGPECPKGERFEGADAYQDNKTIKLKLTDLCNYSIVIKIGESEASPLALTASTISYERHIQPILQKSCSSCHAGFASYQGARASAEAIVMAVEEQTMPPDQALPLSDIAAFVAWADDGFLERDPIAAKTTVLEQQISKVYYRNNNNDSLMAYELLGRTTYELRRSLWLQDDGLTLGLETKQLYTFYDATR
jgi:hypothetical protein